MSGYKAGYSEAHSPWYQDGQRDGGSDATLERRGVEPIGPDPAKKHSAMYMKGYREAHGGT